MTLPYFFKQKGWIDGPTQNQPFMVDKNTLVHL